MTTIQTVVLIAHTIIALLIIILVLLQRGKGADAGAAFGAGASGTVFGAQGSSNFFSRATAIMATVFFASSLALAYMSSQRATTVDSVLENAAPLDLSGEEAPSADAIDAADGSNATEGTESPDALLPDLESELPAMDPDAADAELPALEPAETENDESAPQQRR